MQLAKSVGLEVRGNGKVKYRTETVEDIDVRAVTANIGEMDVEEPATGRYISDADNEHRANITLTGADVAKRFFLSVEALGKSIYIDRQSYEAIRVAKKM